MTTRVLPVWNQASGKVEAVLLLEPTDEAGGRRPLALRRNALDAAFGLDAGDSLGLLCDRKTGVASAIGNLANHCLLAALGDDDVQRQPPAQRDRPPSAATAAASA